MTDKIFLLPDENALVPVPRAQFVADLIATVPEDWSDMSGMLVARDPTAAWNTGYAFNRFGTGVQIVGRRITHNKIDEAPRPDLAALLIERRAPGFITFDDTGFFDAKQFLVAHSLAVGFLRQGYQGWLSINNGKGRKYADQKPAQIDLHQRYWNRLVDKGPCRTMPPAVVLSWDEGLGGKLSQLEPVHAICCRALQEWTDDLSNLGEAAYV